MKVKIKTWEDMKKEYGLNQYGNINLMYPFLKEMENYVPEDRIIEIEKRTDEGYIWVADKFKKYIITDEMIEE